MTTDAAPAASAGPDPDAPAEQWSEHVLTAALGAIDVLAIHLGDRLGWYRALSEHGPLTADALAHHTAASPRYAAEWLAQQAATGILVSDGHTSPRYTLPAGAAEALTDPHSLAYIAPLARMLAASAAQLPALVAAYRSGGGVSWDALGDDARWSQADMNRPWFETALAPALASVAELDAVLREPGCRILDVACGAGWGSIALALAYPEATVLGVDIDEPSITKASTNAAEAGVSDRVTFVAGDAGRVLADDDSYGCAFVFEALHDMPQPVEVLAAIRRSVRPGAPVVVMDEAVADAPSVGEDVERLMYGFSLLVCLPDSMSASPTAATGTVMRPATLRRYAIEAGFRDVDIVPIEGFAFFRFYTLIG